MSFVQSAEDIRRCRSIIHALGADIPIIAKIEKLSAIEQIESIAELADGLMVARETSESNVEWNVFQFSKKNPCRWFEVRKTGHLATQMLESMVYSANASPADIADVANGVLEGADGVMLSAEVASGKFPLNCIQQMATIIEQVETWKHKRSSRSHQITESKSFEGHEAIAKAACDAADTINARAIICLT